MKGLRQVGKSHIVLRFAKENYENYIVYDFRHQKELHSIFTGNLDVDSIINASLSYFPEKKFVPGKTVLVFEEINDCIEARTSLKPFAIDGRYDVIGTGSLLGAPNYRRKKKMPIPTGYEEFLEMHSMDCEEFLWVHNTPESAIQALKDSLKEGKKLPRALEEYFGSLMKRYMAIGGLPEVVCLFIENNGNYMVAREKLLSILGDYRADFGRFIDDKNEEEIDYKLQSQLNETFDSIPKQLSRENDNLKFKFADIRKGARSSDYVIPMDWLEKAGLVLRVFNAKSIKTPLTSNANQASYKAFLADAGLLMALFPSSTLQELLAGTLGARKGALYENIGAIMIAQTGFPFSIMGNMKII